MKKYRACVVDDDPNIRDILVECLRFTDFEATGYDEAEKLLRSLTVAGSFDEAPDLIIVDMKLKPDKMSGVELIAELTVRNIPSEVVAISGNYPSADLVEAIKIGAGAMLPKPFGDLLQLIGKMEHLAEIGRKRRLRLNGNIDPSRQQRPVFLSYCGDDERLATGLRRNIEAQDVDVWYAPTTLGAGDEWRPHVVAGIDQAHVFIALITDNYLTSPICYGELLRFYRRMESSPEPRPLLLPVLDGLSEGSRNKPLIGPILERYQHIDLSTSFIDGLTSIQAKINLHMLKRMRARRRNTGGVSESNKSKAKGGMPRRAAAHAPSDSLEVTSAG
jgi:CheY-like chemotaxis protein